ncbi:MAG: chloromuconate cycloisomerase [Verrucomicrobia bacterium]|nr:chloromuconate cycloisomerase [Verrucomicrobiota bacterium]
MKKSLERPGDAKTRINAAAIKIARIHAVVTTHPLREERIVVSHAGRHSESTFLIVVVEDQDGLHGYGEAATTLLWSGESAQTAKWMVDSVIAPQLTGATLDHPGAALAVMDKAIHGNPFTKSAIDTALWDLWAKRRGVPAWKLFGDREPVRSIPTRASIGAYPLEKTVMIAREFWTAGVRILKFKVGVSGLDDAGRLRSVREELGDEPVFTVDYNGAFRNAADAVRSIESLLPLKIALAEQPTHRERIGLMAEVRKQVEIPILADESIFTPDHLAEALDLDAFDILSLYPGKNGGFTRSLEMARTAFKADKPCVIGSNLETDLGQAAMAWLAAASAAFPVRQFACDLASSLYYAQPSVTQPLIVRNGEIIVPDGPGFGVTPVMVQS